MMTIDGASARERLEQVYRRDPAAEGRFWCSVVTTGIYCRPTCPSRAARPENIRFHDTLEEARATGFRPCRRCRPEQVRSRQQELVEAARRRIEAGRTAPGSAALAQALGISPSHLHRLFRRFTGLTPAAYGRAFHGRSRAGARLAPLGSAAGGIPSGQDGSDPFCPIPASLAPR